MNTANIFIFNGNDEVRISPIIHKPLIPQNDVMTP